LLQFLILRVIAMGGAVSVSVQRDESGGVSCAAACSDAHSEFGFDEFNPASYFTNAEEKFEILRKKDPAKYKFCEKLGMIKFAEVVKEATVRLDADVEIHQCNNNTTQPSSCLPLDTGGKSHLEIMSSHLSSLPCGAESQRKIRFVRLLKKSALFQDERVLTLVQRLKEVVEGVRISLEAVQPYMMGGSGAYITMKGSLTPHAHAALTSLTCEETCAALREELEHLLFWRSEQRDNLYEMFDLTQGCPPFTFISHRWAPGGRALGLHNELVGMLAFAPEEYLWLDCSAAPQNPESFQNGNCLKIIWNIDVLLEASSNILSYYAATGLHLREIPSHIVNPSTDGVGVSVDYDSDEDEDEEWDIEDVCVLSDGLLTMHQAYTSAAYADIHNHYTNCVARRSLVGGNRLWCCLERSLGKAKLVTADDSGGSFFRNLPRAVAILPGRRRGDAELKKTEGCDEEGCDEEGCDEEEGGEGKESREQEQEQAGGAGGWQEHLAFLRGMFSSNVISMTSTTGTARRDTALHASHGFSMDCYSADDIEPVSTLLYQAGALPALLKDQRVQYWATETASSCDGGSAPLARDGVLLPEAPYFTPRLQVKNGHTNIGRLSAEYPLDVSLPNCGPSHGWYFDLATETFFFSCEWPQNDKIPRIFLQLHLSCLIKSKSKTWNYNRADIDTGIFDMETDFVNKFVVKRKPCIMCEKGTDDDDDDEDRHLKEEVDQTEDN
jgi:hypothetical protein